MSALIDLLNKRIAPTFGLVNFDHGWQNTLATSIACRPWFVLKNTIGKTGSLAKFGNWLQIASFAIVALLFLVLPAQQFTSDKEGLALIVAAALGARLLGALLGGKEVYKPTAIDAVVLAYLGVNLIATFSSHYLMDSIKGFAKMVVYVCSYFLFAGVLEPAPRKRTLWILGGLLTAGVLVSLHGLYQYKIGVAPLATWEDPNVESKTTRIYSTLRNPNLLAGYLVPMVPVALGLAAEALTNWKGWKRYCGVIFLGISALTALAVFLTGSRGGYVGIGVGAACMAGMVFFSVWSSRPKLRPFLLFACVVLPILGALVLHQFPSYEQRVLSIFAGREHSSNAYRMNVYNSSLRMLKDSWWIGVGPGNSTFRLAYGLYMKSGFDALGTYCVPLEVAVECGVIGLGIFIALIGSLVSRAHSWFWADRTYAGRWIVAGAAAGIYAMMVHGAVDTVFYRPQVQLIFWLLAAIVVALKPESKSEEQQLKDEPTS